MNPVDELSMREKSALISLLAVLLVYGGYFVDLVRGVAEPTLSAMLYTSVCVVIVLVVIEIVFHIVLGTYNTEDAMAPADERDREISRRARAFSHQLLSAGVILVLGRAIIGGALFESNRLEEVTLYEVANLLLFALVVSELVFYGAQVYFYRRGVDAF